MPASRPWTCPAVKGVATPLVKVQELAKSSTSDPRYLFDHAVASSLAVSASLVYRQPVPPRNRSPLSSPLCTLALFSTEQHRQEFRIIGPLTDPPTYRRRLDALVIPLQARMPLLM